MELPFLTNQRLDDKKAMALLETNNDECPILFSVIGEVAPDSRYGDTALVVCADRLYTFDFSAGEASR